MAMLVPVSAALVLLPAFVAVGCGRDHPPTPPADSPLCDELAAGGDPAAPAYFLWDLQKLEDCGPQVLCSDTVTIHDGCQLTISGIEGQVYNPTQTNIEMSPQECEVARSLVSNPRFLNVLTTGVGCEPGQRKEVFTVELPNHVGGTRDTNDCPEPTVAAERTCMGDFIFRTTGRTPGGPP